MSKNRTKFRDMTKQERIDNAKERIKEEGIKKFKYAAIGVFMVMIIMLWGMMDNKAFMDEFSKPFIGIDSVTETEIKKYMYFHCVLGTFEYAIENRDFPDKWTEQQIEDFYIAVDEECHEISKRQYEEMK